MFEKKFRVRLVRHLPDCDYYNIEYAHYRLFCRWKKLYYALGDHWNPCYSYDTALSIANGLMNINDVNQWHYREQGKINEYARAENGRRKRYKDLYAPIDVQYIK